MRQARPGRWELRAAAGRWPDGRPRTLYRTVSARNQTEAAGQLVAFLDEIAASPLPESREIRDMTVDEAVELFLTEYLGADKGRVDKTINDYRRLHRRWFSPTIGSRRVSDLDTRTIDHLFGAMRKAGLSGSRLNQAKSLYRPFFRWAKRRGMITRDPMVDFAVPTSTYLSHERVPPEVEQLVLLLRTAVEVVPDIAPILMLGAATGMRRGELVGIRRSRILPDEHQIMVDSAVSESKQVKGPKTRRQRTFHIDAETMSMLTRVCEEIEDRATKAGATLCDDPFLFSLTTDCSQPMPPDYLTKRVAVLKGHLGIEDKRPGTIELEDRALELRRQPPGPRPAGMTGPAPKGGMSFKLIGAQLGRSERWAVLAVQAAERREHATVRGLTGAIFDGSILALRKFTSTELLDAGFNIGMVAQRQGHGPQVLARHYSKSRASSDRKAADHLGRVVHASGTNSAP